MNENTKRLEPVPFDAFAEHLGPKHETVKDTEYILSDGTMLTSMPDIPWLYQSAEHLVTGEAAIPKVYTPVYAGASDLQPSAFDEIGPLAQLSRITAETVPMGLPGFGQRQEPGFVLDSGYVLLNSERTPDGGYKAGAGMDGMYMMTGQVFQPLQDENGRIVAFMAQTPEREKQIVHQGYAIIDRMQAGAVEFVLGENPRAPQPYVTWRHTIGDAPTDFYWGHYFGSYHKAKADLKTRAKEYIQMNNEEKPTSVRAQLAQMQQEQKQASPNPARVQEER
ncbi:hypothetical protein [Butyricicoccus sp.]|uniref:hypothetical protein n=1 Tax=Butyricicoccus sp. TaxID=2049021 RepID=UPI003AAE2659